jgi:hypothetical protein
VTGATALKKAADSGEINQFERQEFLSLYPRRDKYIQKLPGKDWLWQERLLNDYEILGVISDEGRGLHRGCAWAHKTRMAVLDIDEGSKYRNRLQLTELTEKLAAVGLVAKPYQSSNSGGWHLYLFFDEWEDSEEVKTTLRAWLKAQQYEIVGGTLEIFPSGNALRLPLQHGFAWLAADGTIRTRREELREDAALAAFLTDLQTNSRNWSEAKDRIQSQLEVVRSDQDDGAQGKQERLDTDGFQPLFWRGIDWDKYQRGQKYWEEGLTGPKQRHDAVLCIGHYLWYGDESAGLKALPYLRNASARAELIEAWLRAKNNGHSRAVNSNQWSDIRSDIDRACSWTAQDLQDQKLEPYPLTDRLIKRLAGLYRKTGKLWTVAELRKANDDKSQDARAKITAAVRQCVDQGLQITRNSLAQITGCSPNTISKHRDLWALLKTGSHEYSGGAGGFVLAPVLLAASSQSGCSEQEIFPTGLVGADSGDLELGHHETSVVCPEVFIVSPVDQSPDAFIVQSDFGAVGFLCRSSNGPESSVKDVCSPETLSGSNATLPLLQIACKKVSQLSCKGKNDPFSGRREAPS